MSCSNDNLFTVHWTDSRGQCTSIPTGMREAKFWASRRIASGYCHVKITRYRAVDNDPQLREQMTELVVIAYRHGLGLASEYIAKIVEGMS